MSNLAKLKSKSKPTSKQPNHGPHEGHTTINPLPDKPPTFTTTDPAYAGDAVNDKIWYYGQQKAFDGTKTKCWVHLVSDDMLVKKPAQAGHLNAVIKPAPSGYFDYRTTHQAMTESPVHAWVCTHLGLEMCLLFCNKLIEAGYTEMKHVHDISGDELKQLGFSVSKRKQFLRAIKAGTLTGSSSTTKKKKKTKKLKTGGGGGKKKRNKTLNSPAAPMESKGDGSTAAESRKGGHTRKISDLKVAKKKKLKKNRGNNATNVEEPKKRDDVEEEEKEVVKYKANGARVIQERTQPRKYTLEEID